MIATVCKSQFTVKNILCFWKIVFKSFFINHLSSLPPVEGTCCNNKDIMTHNSINTQTDWRLLKLQLSYQHTTLVGKISSISV